MKYSSHNCSCLGGGSAGAEGVQDDRVAVAGDGHVRVGGHEDGHCLMNVWAYKKYLKKI